MAQASMIGLTLLLIYTCKDAFIHTDIYTDVRSIKISIFQVNAFILLSCTTQGSMSMSMHDVKNS